VTPTSFDSCLILVDLKSENILVGFEDRSVIKDFVQSQALYPMARKVKDDRVVYRSHNEFGPLKSFGIPPKIGDFGLAQRIIDSRRNIHPIQPDHYRAPEVIVGIGRSYSTDIWNLGVLAGRTFCIHK
jgi:serine/threonine-protein kinase SRPK3